MGVATNPRLRGLTLTATERCNLRCGYCYVPVERGRVMSGEVADAAVDLLVRHSDGAPEITLSFFGGEPFLAVPLLRRAIDRVRSAARRGQRVVFATPTNGTLLRDEALDLCRSTGMRLAVSVDGDDGCSDRVFAGGRDSTPALLPLLPDMLALDPEARVTARMTVTPSNVGTLATNVRGLARLGFRRIVFLPAFELPWDDAAVETWGREHRRIGTWLTGVWGTGRRPPDLPTWRGVEARLTLGKPRRACGAGARLAAVATDGRIFPCYRFVFAGDNDSCALGHVDEGFTNRSALALFGTLDPSFARPEDGDCATCSARDGCTFFCPALGHWMLRDPLAVPASACRLSRAAVEAIRPYAALERRPPARPSRGRWAAAAAVAAAVTGAGALASCDSGEPAPGDTAADTPVDVVDGASDDGIGPGACPVGADADADVEDVPVGGLCPVGADADADADADVDEDIPGPGRCPVGADADADDVPIGGACPVWVDADADADEDIPGPGACPVWVDADADADEDAPGPGMCPVPGLC